MDLVTFTEEILNEKLNFLCSGTYGNFISTLMGTTRPTNKSEPKN